jgi:hypothetical protein
MWLIQARSRSRQLLRWRGSDPESTMRKACFWLRSGTLAWWSPSLITMLLCTTPPCVVGTLCSRPLPSPLQNRFWPPFVHDLVNKLPRIPLSRTRVNKDQRGEADFGAKNSQKPSAWHIGKPTHFTDTHSLMCSTCTRANPRPPCNAATSELRKLFPSREKS